MFQQLIPDPFILPIRLYGPTVLSVRSMGALADGVSDDTSAFDAAFKALPADGGTVLVPPGVYVLDPVRNWRITRSFCRLLLQKGAIIITKPHGLTKAYTFFVDGVTDFTLEGYGAQIIGERDKHDFTKPGTHEWDHVLYMRNSSRVNIEGVDISKATGDGISLGGDLGNFDVVVYNVGCEDNRRQGLTIGRGRGYKIVDSTFGDTGGTAPSAGIDIEPDAGGYNRTEDVLILRCKTPRNKVGILVFTRPLEPGEAAPAAVDGVRIWDCDVSFNSGNGIETARVSNIDIRGGRVHHQQNTGIKIGPETLNLHIADVVFEYNYTKLAARVRAEFEQFGWTKALDRDILQTTSAVGPVYIGRNYYLTQVVGGQLS